MRIRPLSDHLACPIDGTPLHLATPKSLCCANGHTFDRAREGYFNLLLVQHKASLDPGDSKEMVAARRRILDAGLYRPIAGQLVASVGGIVDQWPSHKPVSILDAGCGEGTYLVDLAAALAASKSQGDAGRRFRLIGIDISKWAIQAAAKRASGCIWAVATNRHLPIVPGSIDIIVSMFGFPVWPSFKAAQPDGGHVVVADPGPEHLVELRSIIYPSVTRSAPPSLEAAERVGYRLVDTIQLTFPVLLADRAQIADLLAMTPHGYRAPQEGREALARIDDLTVTGDVIFRILRAEAKTEAG